MPRGFLQLKSPLLKFRYPLTSWGAFQQSAHVYTRKFTAPTRSFLCFSCFINGQHSPTIAQARIERWEENFYTVEENKRTVETQKVHLNGASAASFSKGYIWKFYSLSAPLQSDRPSSKNRPPGIELRHCEFNMHGSSTRSF